MALKIKRLEHQYGPRGMLFIKGRPPGYWTNVCFAGIDHAGAYGFDMWYPTEHMSEPNQKELSYRFVQRAIELIDDPGLEFIPTSTNTFIVRYRWDKDQTFRQRYLGIGTLLRYPQEFPASIFSWKLLIEWGVPEAWAYAMCNNHCYLYTDMGMRGGGHSWMDVELDKMEELDYKFSLKNAHKWSSTRKSGGASLHFLPPGFTGHYGMYYLQPTAAAEQQEVGGTSVIHEEQVKLWVDTARKLQRSANSKKSMLATAKLIHANVNYVLSPAQEGVPAV